MSCHKSELGFLLVLRLGVNPINLLSSIFQVGSDHLSGPLNVKPGPVLLVDKISSFSRTTCHPTFWVEHVIVKCRSSGCC